MRKRSTLLSTVVNDPPAGAYKHEPGDTDGPGLRCARGCCWSPFGHSTVRDGIPSWHKDACHCHEPKTGTKESNDVER